MLSLRVADQVERMAVVAFADLVFFGKGLPVLSLVRRQGPHPLAQGACVLKRRQDRGPNEFGTVRDSMHGLCDRGIDLERDHFMFGFLGAHGRYRFILSPGFLLPVVSTLEVETTWIL